MYASKQNMIDRYGEKPMIELTDRAEPYTGVIVDAVLDRAFSDADALINSYIASRYKLPMAVTPDVLVRHACVIAFYDLHRDRRPDEVRKDYEDTLSFLRSVSRGDVKLDAAGVEPGSPPAEARVEGPDRIFNRDSLGVY